MLLLAPDFSPKRGKIPSQGEETVPLLLEKNMKETQHKTFSLGGLFATPGVLSEISPGERLAALARHSRCDWGECDPEDWQANDEAVDQELRLFSVYIDRNGVKFWIITEADRSVTTILLPDEY